MSQPLDAQHRDARLKKIAQGEPQKAEWALAEFRSRFPPNAAG
jgi:hypothetical protein